MRSCPACASPVNAITLFQQKNGRGQCAACGSKLKLRGLWWLIVAPSLAALLIPYEAISPSIALSIGLMVVVIAIFSIILWTHFVRVDLDPKD